MVDYHEIFEKFPDGVTLHDVSDGSILATNQGFCDMLGYTREELLNLEFDDLHVNEPPYTTEQAEQYIHQAATEGPQTFEWLDETKAGDPLPVEVHLSQTQIGGEERILAVVRDISERKEREREIERETARFRALFENTSEAVAWVEYQGETPIIREANPAFTDRFDGPAGDVIGEPLDRVVAKEGRRDEAEALSRRVKSGEQLQAEIVRDTVDGPRTFLWEAVPLEDPDAEAIDQAFALYTDISELRRREQELERYETIIEATGDPVYTLDENGDITYVNDAFLEFSGYDADELLGANAAKVIEEEYYERGTDLIRTLLASDQDRGTFELNFVTTDGERIRCESHVALLPFEEEFRGTVGVIRDISDRVEREQRIERERDRSEQFASVVSHDLRNPVTVAAGRLELAKEECDSEHLDAVGRTLDRMETLIDDVLSLARAGEAVGERQAVALEAIVETCWATVDTKDSELVVESDHVVMADESRLRQLLENLFRNAVEHGGDAVTVTVGDLTNGFYVEDDGQGLSEDARETLFEPGYSTTDTGTGFGLNIVQEIAEAHGWDVSTTDSTEGGARFEFRNVAIA